MPECETNAPAPKPKERASVIYSKSGVASVSAADIVRSTRGREEIRKAAELAVNLGLRTTPDSR